MNEFYYVDVIVAILYHKMPDCTATAAQIAERASWSENEGKERLENICEGRVDHNWRHIKVVRNNTSPTTYTLVEDEDTFILEECQLDEYLSLRNKM